MIWIGYCRCSVFWDPDWSLGAADVLVLRGITVAGEITDRVATFERSLGGEEPRNDPLARRGLL